MINRHDWIQERIQVELGEIGYWLKYLQCQCKVLSLNPQNPKKSWMNSTGIYNSSASRGDRRWYLKEIFSHLLRQFTLFSKACEHQPAQPIYGHILRCTSSHHNFKMTKIPAITILKILKSLGFSPCSG